MNIYRLCIVEYMLDFLEKSVIITQNESNRYEYYKEKAKKLFK